MKQMVFGSRSKSNLENVHPTLYAVAELALRLGGKEGGQDFTVICGYRDKAGQDQAVKDKTTKVKFPNSAHNQLPSCAIDVIPYPFKGWKDASGFLKIAAQFFEAAQTLGVKIRWGGDFNRDGDKTTSDAWDKPHFELHPWRNFAGKGK